jgi:hypothetical protein
MKRDFVGFSQSVQVNVGEQPHNTPTPFNFSQASNISTGENHHVSAECVQSMSRH